QAKTQVELDKNAQKYLDQISTFLDVNKIEVVKNADWLGKLTFADVVNLASSFTVAQMLERDMYQDRIKNEQPIYLHEFMYPLMQGYDSVELKIDLELGGTDQIFNLLAGRTIQKAYGQKPQHCLTVPLLEGTDGIVKMGKSEDNYIAVDDEPKDMFGKVMSITDNLIVKYFELATEVSMDEIKKIEQSIEKGENPMIFKKQLAKEIVKIYHDEAAANMAEEQFTKVFSEHKLPDDIEVRALRVDSMNIVELISSNEMASSKSEARRLIEQGAVKINEAKVSDVDMDVDLSNETLIQVGKRKFLKVVKG
ncbi:tyrosine--tRNA ligase, partial [Patescibacteria group bacterium]